MTPTPPTHDAAAHQSVAGDDAPRTILVTGGTRGIGREIAAAFLADGATVVVCARTAPDELPAGMRFVACDVREPEQVRAVVDDIVATEGRLDVLVNNAGGAPPAESATVSPRFNERILALNLLAPMTFAQAVHPVMTSQAGGGVIINIASVSGMRANPHGVAYGAAKAGLLNLTETLAVEWGPAIRVVAVTAGMIRTEEAGLFYGDEAGIAAVGATIPAGRMGEPADIADACRFLASDQARWITGANLVVHGGGERPRYLDASTGAVNG